MLISSYGTQFWGLREFEQTWPDGRSDCSSTIYAYQLALGRMEDHCGPVEAVTSVACCIRATCVQTLIGRVPTYQVWHGCYQADEVGDGYVTFAIIAPITLC